MTRPPNPPNPFGSLGSRFGTSKLNFNITPVMDTLVRFELNDLGEPLYRFLKCRRRKDQSDIDAALEVLEQESEHAAEIAQRLDAAWQGYHLHGAVLLYVWRDDVRQCVTAEAAAEKSPLALIRACDPMLVLNVLARARSNLLMQGVPVALERAFLERVFVTDDPRITALARTTGYRRENLPTPPVEPDKNAPKLPQK